MGVREVDQDEQAGAQEEYKQMEGDPQIKSKIRQKQRELARSRMMSSVPKVTW